MTSADDPYVLQHAGLVAVHRALDAALTGWSVDDAVARALAAGSFLLGHHHAEDTVLFPGLRRGSRLRSTDVAFLDACDRAHHELHALCERLLATRDPTALTALGGEIRARFAAHIADEEVGLAPARLREMVTPDGLAEIARALEALRAGR